MAAEQNNADLRTVAENLVSHPAFRRIVSDAVQQSSSGQNVNATTNVLPSTTKVLPSPDANCNPCSELEDEVAGEVLLLRLSQFLVQAPPVHVVLTRFSATVLRSVLFCSAAMMNNAC